MKFSVVIPLYNKQKYILKAIRSVLNQTLTTFELIVVDDGSTDDSVHIIEQINDKRLKILKKANEGVSAARNNGVKIAKYDYIAFLDADDWWDLQYLEEMSKTIKEFPDGGLFSSRFLIVKKKRAVASNIHLDSGFKAGYIDYFKLYNQTFCQLINSSSVIVPKKVFIKLGGFHTSITKGEDFHLWARIALKYKIVYLNKNLSFYNQDVDSENRATRRIHPPKSNYVFYFSEFDEFEKKNYDLKVLLDHIRIGNYKKYLLHGLHFEKAKKLLACVDVNKQSFFDRVLLKLPKNLGRVFCVIEAMRIFINLLLTKIKRTVLKR